MGCMRGLASGAVKQRAHYWLLLVALATLLMAPLHAQTTATTTTFVIAPQGGYGILQAGDGNFYATSGPSIQTCNHDTAHLCAYIFQVTPGGQSGIFHAFQLTTSALTPNLDGVKPTSLFVGADGNLYGTCQFSGPGGSGTIFQITLQGKSAGDITVLKSFISTDAGAGPIAMIQAADGNFYWTNGLGIYRLASDGSVSTVYEYAINQMTGLYPMGNLANSLVQGSDGNLYITQVVGPQTAPGTAKSGAISQLTLSGQLTILHHFAEDGSEGSVDIASFISPGGPLVQASDGTFYGVTKFSGPNSAQGPGVAYQVTTGSGFTVLHQFNGTDEGNYTNAALTLGSDGNLYGTTQFGGDTASANCTPIGCGTFYQLTPSGVLTTLHKFEGGFGTSTVVSDNPQVDGEHVAGALVQTDRGFFYGTTLGGTTGDVTVFKSSLTPSVSSPISMTFNPPQVEAGHPTTLSWQVSNAFSLTAQQCVASIVGNLPGAGTWSGLQPGRLLNKIFSGGAEITPTAGGTYTYALTCGGTETQLATLVVAGTSPLIIETQALLKGTVSQPYKGLLSVSGGTPQYTWVVGGKLPKGMNFDNTSGLLTGTPLQFGDYQLSFGVQDSSKPPETTSAAFTLTIDSGLVLFAELPNPVVGKDYSQALKAEGGLPQYTFSLDSGTLPTGLNFNASAGVLSGTPTEAGVFTFTITVSDSENPKATDTSTFTLSTVPGALSIVTDALLPAAKVAVPYSTGFTASGGTPPYQWTFGPQTKSYLQTPPGLSLSSAGVLSGTPIQWKFYNFSVTVTDSATPPNMVSSVFGLSVQATLKATNNFLPDGTVGIPMTVPLTATGGIPPYVWHPQIALNDTDIGVLFDGTSNLLYNPQRAGSTSMRLIVQDSEANPDQDSIDLPLTILPTPLATTTTLTSSNSTAGTGENITLTATVAVAGGATPIGQVIFYNGTVSIGTATLDANGFAILQTSFSANGVYPITAAYGGNPSYAASTSAPLTETIVTPTISASISPGSLTIQAGKSGQLVITLTPNNGYSGAINFSCGTVPAHVSCTFVPPSITIAAGSGPVTDTLTVQTDARQPAAMLMPGSGPHGNTSSAAAFWLPVSLLGMLVLIPRRRRPARPGTSQIILGVCLFCVAAMVSCGGGPMQSPPANAAAPGTYVVPITLSIGGGGTQSVNATITVD